MTNAAVYEDGFNLLCGELLGNGIHRKVFECRIRSELVVKVEYAEGFRYFANAHEMKIWHDAPDKVRRWLAPCDYLSPDGRVLLQRRVDPLPLGYTLPEKMPAFLGDFKRENYGLFDGRMVCVDYAMAKVSCSLGLRKVDWR